MERRRDHYLQSSTLRLSRLSRASLRKGVEEFGGFCFEERARLNLTLRSPGDLVRSLLAWFDVSRFVASMLQLGSKRRELIREVLEVLVDGYDDPSVAETLERFDWWRAPDNMRIDTAGDVDIAWHLNATDLALADAETLRRAASVCERLNNLALRDDLRRIEKKRLDFAEICRSALAAAEARSGPRRPHRGAKRSWLTPVLYDLEPMLREVEGRWELLAQLVRELERAESTTGENVRLRLAEFRRRTRRP